MEEARIHSDRMRLCGALVDACICGDNFGKSLNIGGGTADESYNTGREFRRTALFSVFGRNELLFACFDNRSAQERNTFRALPRRCYGELHTTSACSISDERNDVR